MRQIKFRGKRIDNGHWVYGDYFKTPLSDENSGAPQESGWFFLTGEERHCIGQNGVAFVVDPSTVGQFIYLDGEEGKDLYEGDIVQLPVFGFTGLELSSDMFITGAVRYLNGAPYVDNMLILNLNVLKIIGNIYDNPELLKGHSPKE